jgi:hypothetical protein
VTDRNFLGKNAPHALKPTSIARTSKPRWYVSQSLELRNPLTLTANRNAPHPKSALFHSQRASAEDMRSYVDVAARLEHAEALVGKLRAELAKAHFASASGSNIPLPSTSSFTAETDSAADPRAGTKPLDVPTAALCVMRATFQSLAAPPIAQHTDDTLDPNVAGEVCVFCLRWPSSNASSSFRNSR